MADNTGKTTDDFRLRKLNVTTPATLSAHFIQAGVIDEGINLENLCGEGGNGSFTWLVRLDTQHGTMVTGGAPPSSDPFGVGYCFVNQTLAGFAVTSVTVKVTQGTNGAWSSDVIPKLLVPIFVNGDASNVIVLPLTEARLQEMTISPDGNCIGTYNPNGVTSPIANVCLDEDDSSCERWRTNGSLGGYITLREADSVNIATLSRSLCVVLTSGSATTPDGAHCATNADGSVVAKGDFCSTTNAAGGCQDSYWLAATFAASAALITDGSQVDACNGMLASGGDGGSSDGGTDGGSAGGDAAGD